MTMFHQKELQNCHSSAKSYNEMKNKNYFLGILSHKILHKTYMRMCGKNFIHLRAILQIVRC